MLQRQIVNALEWQIDIEDPAFTKYPITTLPSLTFLISVKVTIYRTVPIERACIAATEIRRSV
jgi:hypothetical protein